MERKKAVDFFKSEPLGDCVPIRVRPKPPSLYQTKGYEVFKEVYYASFGITRKGGKKPDTLSKID